MTTLIKYYLLAFVASFLTLWIVFPHQVEAQAVSKKTYNELVEGAKKEGKLVIWDTTRGRGKGLFRLFQKKYPFIKTRHALVQSTQVIQKLIMESKAGRAPSADVLAANSVSFVSGKKEGVFMSFPWKKVFHEIPSKAIDKDNFGVATYANVWTMAYNTGLLSKEKLPKSYEDLLKPEWKGKLGIDIRANPWTFLVASGAWSQEKGESFIKKLRDTNPNFVRGGTANTNLLVAGESPIATVYLFNVIDFKNKGAPIDWIPMEPLGGNTAGRIIPKGAPHPHAAVLYIGWLTSPEGQMAQEKTQGRSLPYEGLNTPTAKMLAGKKLGVIAWGDTESALRRGKVQGRLMRILGTRK